ncbi:MAG: hypothetical protein HN738_02505 [Gammaproteobacteria bacterium]|jgi:hypothetical protein|nr:hypothetical protein [Gammaproteobacteria bacterium]
MNTRAFLGAIFNRVQRDREIKFSGVRVECGSWFSAYQYVYEIDPLTGKDVTDFSTEMKSMEDVECNEDGEGKVVFTIKKEIVNRIKGDQNGKMEPGAEKARKSTA